jgi:hypothetical protein
LKEFK